MIIRGKDMAVSLLAVGTAAVAGYLLRSSRSRDDSPRSKADLGARLVDRDEIPADATVVDVSSRRLDEIPGARRAIERAVRNRAREDWEHVTLDRGGAWSVVDAIRDSLPYYDGSDSRYNGVYVHYENRFVVLDAIGWARLEESLY
ncbi:hypothetical protein EA462_11460 [Natrarchaeobius halalkaliphilus]|uniref:Uncharacterized protein n=1 Tax=Natrarchaeobius halalkaliphilus TaxID=1679091 RepID=A0A3N6M6P5_9EURY|nr:hypothetical protein [Natrarchaeobius halalkaliphilus]RQG88996.1 hypothetical protein EA462_11460 [Natrarchaeobius halalkaliphilus]